MENLLPLLFGTLLIAAGTFGHRFSIGLHGKVIVPAWYGRSWLIGNGVFLVAAATARLLRFSAYTFFLADENLWKKAQCFFLSLFETYNGVGLSIIGIIGSVAFFKKREWRFFWLALVIAIAGEPFAYEGIWNFFHGCP